MKLSALSDLRLADLIRQGNKEAEAAMLDRHERLIFHYLRKHPRYLGYADDLAQEGRIGLLRAASNFDGSKGFKFSTYAMYWIHKFCSRAMNKCSRIISLPATMQKDFPQDAYLSLDITLGRDGVTIGDLQMDSNTLGSDETLHLLECKRIVEKALSGLDPKRRQVITMAWGLNGRGGRTMNLAEIARELGVTREAVRMMHKRAMAQMQAAVSDELEVL